VNFSRAICRRWILNVCAKALAIAGLLGAGPPVLAATSGPGAMNPFGEFYVLNDSSLGAEVWQFKSTGWNRVGLIGGAKVHSSSTPGGLTNTGGMHVWVENSTTREIALIHWEPTGGVGTSLFLTDIGEGTALSPPSDVMYGNRVYSTAKANSKAHGVLSESFSNVPGAPVDFELKFGNIVSSLKIETPCICHDGNIFATTSSGKLVQMWWNNANRTWNWIDHGVPVKPNRWGNFGVKAVSVGAAMAGSKVFVTCDDGSLRQLWWNGSGWRWHNHGRPFGYSVEGRAVAMYDGKLFVRATKGGRTFLCQLYYGQTGIWTWYDHQGPSGTVGEPVASRWAETVAIKDSVGNFRILSWAGGQWVWNNVGRP
jgi:hypothetical protein